MAFDRGYIRPKGRMKLKPGLDITTGMIGFWPGGYHRVATTRLEDISGNKRHATPVNMSNPYSAKWKAPVRAPAQQKKLGEVIILDGTNDYINMNYNIKTHLSGGWSLMCWVKPFDNTGFGWIYGQDAASAIVFLIGMSDSAGKTHFNVGGLLPFPTGSGVNTGAPDTFVANEWQLFTVTWDGTTDAAAIKIYKDEALTHTLNPGGFADGLESTNARIGTNHLANAFEKLEMGPMMTFSRALTLAEIKKIFRQPWHMVEPKYKPLRTACTPRTFKE